MLSTTTSTFVSEESDVTAAVPVQDRPENIAGSLVDDARTDATDLDQGPCDDGAAPATADDHDDGPAPRTPDAEALAARVQVLLGAVLEVERLSRRAREAAASDLAHYDALVTARQVLEHHQREAAGIRERAEQLAASAFGQQARAVAASTLAEARQLEQTLGDLAGQRTAEAADFQAEHPDVEALVEERQQQAAEARRRELETERARRLADLLQAGELALRQGALAEAQECLRRLKAEFPSQEEQIAALRTRLHQRAQAARDATARAALEQAAEHQGRGDLEAAVTVLEQLEVRGLSPEVGEDVFGAWSQACSRLGAERQLRPGHARQPAPGAGALRAGQGSGADPDAGSGRAARTRRVQRAGYGSRLSARQDCQRPGNRRAGPWLPARGTAGHPRRRWPELRQLAELRNVARGGRCRAALRRTRTRSRYPCPTPSGWQARRIGQYLVTVEQRGSGRSQCLVVSDDPARARRWADPAAARRFWADCGLPTDVPFEIDLVPEVGAEVCDFWGRRHSGRPGRGLHSAMRSLRIAYPTSSGVLLRLYLEQRRLLSTTRGPLFLSSSTAEPRATNLVVDLVQGRSADRVASGHSALQHAHAPGPVPD